MKTIKICVNNINQLLIGKMAEEEIENFPEDVVYIGEIEHVSGIPELVDFALRKRLIF